MKRTLLSLTLFVLVAMGMVAQIVTTSPAPLQEHSKDVVLTYNAASPLGNNALKGLADDFDVYAHIGVITNLSKSGSDWKYVVAPWPESGNSQSANTAKNRLTRTAADTYTLAIGDIRTYFGITDPSEYVKQIAIVFRNADGSKTGKTKNNGDIFVDVLFDGFAVELNSDHPDRLINKTTTITYTLEATEAADLSLSVDGKEFASVKGEKTLTASYTFDTVGNFFVEGKAVYEGVTYSKKLEVSYPASSPAADYPAACRSRAPSRMPTER